MEGDKYKIEIMEQNTKTNGDNQQIKMKHIFNGLPKQTNSWKINQEKNYK